MSNDRARRRREQRARQKIGAHDYGEWNELAAKLMPIISEHREELLAAAEARRGSALSDQLAAAVTDATRGRERFTEVVRRTLPHGDIYPDETALTAMFGHYLRIVGALADGSINHCPHVGIRTPAPAIAAVFGDRVDCFDCYSPMRRPHLSQIEDHTCDLCRGYVPDQTMHQLTPQVGPLLLLMGVCEPCIDRMDLDGTRQRASS